MSIDGAYTLVTYTLPSDGVAAIRSKSLEACFHFQVKAIKQRLFIKNPGYFSHQGIVIIGSSLKMVSKPELSSSHNLYLETRLNSYSYLVVD